MKNLFLSIFVILTMSISSVCLGATQYYYDAAGTLGTRGASSTETAAQTRDDVWLSPASIPHIMANPGTIGRVNLDTNVEVLNADKGLLTTAKPIQWFDANGTDRHIILPYEASSNNLVFTIYNDSDEAGEHLIIQNDPPTDLVTIGPGQGIQVSCDGIKWKVLDNEGIYYDAVSGNRGIGTAKPDSFFDISIPGSGSVIGGMKIFAPYLSSSSDISFKVGQSNNKAVNIGYHYDSLGAEDYGWFILYGDIIGEGLVLRHGGKVGIGTTSPNAKLQVMGRITKEGTFAEMYIYDNSTAQSIPTGSTYTKIDQFTANGTCSNAIADYANNKITLTYAGKYKISGTVSMSSDTNNVVFDAACFLNGVEQPQLHLRRKVATAGDVGDTMLSGFITASAGDELDLRVKTDNGAAIGLTLEYGNLNVEYVGE